MSIVVLLILFFQHSLLLTTTIQPHSEECFYENIQEENTQVKIQFQVVSGGFLDIDFVVYDSKRNILHEIRRKENGKITLPNTQPPLISFCFSNKRSSLSPKAVQFTVDVGDILDPNLANLDSIDPIEKSIIRLSEGLGEISKQQQYLRSREKMHRDLIEKTNTRVMYWSIFQMSVLVGMTFWQIFYLKRLFGKRRSV